MNKRIADIENDFSQWYLDIIYQAEVADQSPVRGCMVIRPYGNAIWENIRTILDGKIKKTGHQNAIFPLFIPQSFLNKEAEHVEGFSPELAVVTHAGGKKLEEPLVVRPTSETIIHYMFARWLHSWRDLPIKINQWANIVRWELRSRPFLRTTEIFWQEGHTAHETAKEAEEEAFLMLDEYVDLAENYLAIPVVKGQKSEGEKFPGADKTLTFEGLMPDGKALQMGTSHLISQNFAKAFKMTFQDRGGKIAYPYLTSWGASTRLVGALIMIHGDEKGLVLPPKIAPIQVVIIPIFKSGVDNRMILDAAKSIQKELLNDNYSVYLDIDETKNPGAKFYKWELKGVPLRIEIGPRDIEKNQVIVADRLGISKNSVEVCNIVKYIGDQLSLIQEKMFEKAKKRMDGQWNQSEKLTEFGPKLSQMGGFFQTGWCGKLECELKLKDYQASIRCLLKEKKHFHCFYCSKKSDRDVIVAKAY